jgi:hypothetical protein
MLRLVLVLLLILVVAALFVPPVRRRGLEAVKSLSDSVVVGLLRATSQFESELTGDGRMEQKLLREQRLRNIQGLALRSQQKRKSAVKTTSEPS